MSPAVGARLALPGEGDRRSSEDRSCEGASNAAVDALLAGGDAPACTIARTVLLHPSHTAAATAAAAALRSSLFTAAAAPSSAAEYASPADSSRATEMRIDRGCITRRPPLSRAPPLDSQSILSCALFGAASGHAGAQRWRPRRQGSERKRTRRGAHIRDRRIAGERRRPR